MTERTKPRYDVEAVPYHFYAPEAKTPTLCEIRGEWVWLMDAERAIHISKFQGRFVPLREVTEEPSADGKKDENVV